MSVQLQSLVWDLPLPQTRKMVLLSLADQANDQGECYPSISTIARRCSVSKRAIFTALSDLESAKLLSRRPLPSQKVLFCINVTALKQLPLIATGERRAPVKEVHRCTSFTGEGNAPVKEEGETGERPSPPIKQPTATRGVCSAREASADPAEAQIIRDEQYNALPEFDQHLIDPYLAALPPGIDLDVLAGFVRHRQASKRPLSIFAWLQVVEELKRLSADGADLNASLRDTAKLGLSSPVDPRPRRTTGGRGPPTPRANDDFSGATYTGTPEHELPEFLRETEPPD